jgi:hypothetical protein
MSGMGVRPYSDTDMPRLQDTVAGWIAEAGSCGYDHIGELPHRIYENLHGRGPVGDLVQLWDDPDGLAGLAISMQMGVAFDVLAAPRLRGGASPRSPFTGRTCGTRSVTSSRSARTASSGGTAWPGPCCCTP